MKLNIFKILNSTSIWTTRDKTDKQTKSFNPISPPSHLMTRLDECQFTKWTKEFGGRQSWKKTYEIAQTEIWSKNSTKPSYLLVQAEWQNC